MRNQLFRQLNPLENSLPNNSLAQIKQMMNTFNTASNPQSVMQNMINNNPQMKQVMDFVRQSGGDPKQAFYKLAEQRGVDPNEVISLLR